MKIFDIAKKTLLEPASLDEKILEKLINSMINKSIEDADFYFQHCIHESWILESSKIKCGNYSFSQGMGIRSISNEKTGYAYCNEISLSSIKELIKISKSVNFNTEVKELKKEKITRNIIPRYDPINPITSIDNNKKINILQSVDNIIRNISDKVKQVYAVLSSSFEIILIKNFNKEILYDIRPLINLSINVIVESKLGKIDSYRSTLSSRSDYHYFINNDRAINCAKNTVYGALTNLYSEEAPAGTMPVVLGPGCPGILLHEAVGHGLEGDFNRKKLSYFSNSLGLQVANKNITVVDNGTLNNKRGSITIDDEGTPSQYTILIEKGKLVNYMNDKINAKLMNMKSTGNCRRSSYSHIPIPRMTNTYMLNGPYHHDEIINSVKHGIYAKNFDGGQVDITSGQFVFSTSQAFLIQDGKITKPIKNAMLIGNGPEIMKKISMVGNNLSLDDGVGTCIKDGQSVPVGVGQPTVKIDEMTVGGTKK